MDPLRGFHSIHKSSDFVSPGVYGTIADLLLIGFAELHLLILSSKKKASPKV